MALTARPSEQATYRIDDVTDGDTIVLRNGQRVRLVQIDTPEVFFGTEYYGPQASARTKGLARTDRGSWMAYAPNPAPGRGLTILAAFPLNWLETGVLVIAWAALCVDVLRQQWISRGAKIAWIVFIVLVPVVSWIAYGIARHRHGVGPGRGVKP